ncbi:MAG: nicotinate-nucleotide adenylyltransferase [Desulfuromonadales bacterium]
MKIGLLGGSFNPVHNAHLQIADEAKLVCGLNRVFFIPAADPPHKPLAGDISFEIRAEMVSMAIAGSPDFSISTVEAERGGKSYSIDTIRTFREHFADDELFFIIGGDSFLEIGTWRCYADIFRSCNLIVVERPGCQITNPFKALPETVKEVFRLEDQTGSLIHESGKVVHFITGTPQGFSSTEIRRLAATGADFSRFVPPDVAAYISQQRIYHKCL